MQDLARERDVFEKLTSRPVLHNRQATRVLKVRDFRYCTVLQRGQQQLIGIYRESKQRLPQRSDAAVGQALCAHPGPFKLESG
jgi:hypothetical protein